MKSVLPEGFLTIALLVLPALNNLIATEYQAEEAYFYQAAVEEWSGDYTGSSESIEVIMSFDMSITATFTDVVIEIPEPDFSMRGYATVSGEGYETTTGGAGGNVTTVTTLAELQAFAASRENNTTPEILYIKGKISAPSTTVVTIKHGANLTILGEGYFGEMENVGLNIRNYKNVIIRNMKIHEVEYPNDAITIDECRHVWVDHNELYSLIGPGIGVDTYDGLLDIKNGSRYVTVSWNHLHHHMKTMLIGHSDNNGDTDRQFRITLHHNYYSNTDGRNPSLRFGAVHMFNNYLEDISDYGIAIRQAGHAKLENNHYESVKLPIATDKFSGPEGFACVSGNIYTGSCTEASNSITQTDCDFWNDLPYSYQFNPANTVAAMVQLYAGVGIISTGETVYLSSLLADTGTLQPSFNPEVTHYELVVPAGTNSVTLTAETGIPGASVTGAGEYQEIPCTAIIVVTSNEGTLSREYQVDIRFEILSGDATLASLSPDAGSLDPVFDPAVTTYNLVLPAGSTSVNLHATANHPNASVSGDGLVEPVPGTAEITVTAEDGTTTLTYTVNVSVATGLTSSGTGFDISIYPNPASEILFVSLPSPSELKVYDLTGKKLMERSVGAGLADLDISGLKPGWYILRIHIADQTVSMKFIRN